MDISARHSEHARKTIASFRGGMYTDDISFSVGTPKDFFSRSEHKGKEEWLDHAILDHPSSHTSMSIVAPHLHLGGKMILFTPSITQIIDAHRVVREKGLPLYLERVIELGGGMSGGRDWALKFVQSRASMRASGNTSSLRKQAEVDELREEVEQEGGAEVVGDEAEWVVSCRPKVGGVVRGGGFLGVWTRIEDRAAFGDDSGFTKGMRSPAAVGTSDEAESESPGSDEFDVVDPR